MLKSVVDGAERTTFGLNEILNRILQSYAVQVSVKKKEQNGQTILKDQREPRGAEGIHSEMDGEEGRPQ